MNPDQGNPYQFIVEPQKPQRPPLFGGGGGGGNSFIKKLVFIIGGAVVFMIIAALVVSMFFSGGTSTEGVVKIVQSGTEIVRVSELSGKAHDQALKNAGAGTSLAIESQKQAWVAWLAENGREMEDEEIGLGENTATDDRLTKAEQASDFDAEYAAVMREALTAYSNELKTTYDASSDEGQRALLSDDYEEVKLLLQQWPE